MKSIKYLFCALLATAFVGCAEDAAFEPGPVDSGAQLSFETSSADMQLMPTDPTEFEVVVTRAAADQAASYAIEVTPASGSEDIFTVGAAEFAAGEESTSVVVSFPNAEIGVAYKATLSLTGDDVAIYKTVSMNISVIRQYTWVVKADAAGNTTAVWTDELLGLYSVGPLPGAVTVYEALEIPGYLKVVGAYTDSFFMSAVGVTGAEFGLALGEPVDIYIHAEDPDAVWIPLQSTHMTVDATYGAMIFGSICEENGFSGAGYGTLSDNVISFPAKSIAVLEELFLDDIYYGNGTGAMGLSLPGAEVIAEVAVEYVGLFTDNATKTDNGVFNFYVNDGTSKVCYALVEGKGVDVDAIASQIADGTLASTELTSFDAPVYVPVAAPGTYSVVAASFNDKGTLGISSAASFKVADPAAGASLLISEGTYSVNVDSSAGSEPSEFYVIATDDEDVFQMSDVFGFGTQSMYTCVIDRDADIAYVTPDFGFNAPFAYYDAEQTMIFAYGGAGEAYDEPWTFALTEVDGALQLSSVATAAMCLDVYAADGSGYLGSAYVVSEGAEITRVGDLPAEAPAKVMATSRLISPALRHAISAKGTVAAKQTKLTKRDNLEVISR